MKNPSSSNKRVVLHVGLPKTGSTSVQTYLEKFRSELVAEGYMFPMLKEPENKIPGHHSDLLRALHRRFYNNDSERIIKKWQDEIDAFIENDALNTFIISQESFGTTKAPIDYGRLFKMFRGVPVEVVIYLRSPEEWITSFYEQLVKGHPARLDCMPHEFNHLNRYLDGGYEGVLRDLATAFPDAQFHIIAFDVVKKTPGIVPAFFKVIRGPLVSDTEIRKNVRSPLYHVAVLRALNVMGATDEVFLKIRKMLRKVSLENAIKNEDRVSIFTNEVRQLIAARYEDDIRYLGKKYGVELPKQLNLMSVVDDPMMLTAEKLETAIEELKVIPSFMHSEAEIVLQSLRKTL